jgi:hypothetical protein
VPQETEVIGTLLFTAIEVPDANPAIGAVSTRLDLHSRASGVCHTTQPVICTRAAFVIVDSCEHVGKMPRSIKDGNDRNKFLIMDVYRQIEKLWPANSASS